MIRTNVSVVVPIYNEEKTILKFHNELISVLKNNKYNWEIIYVVDKSRDLSQSIITKLANIDQRVKYITFTNRIGHQKALIAGILNAKGKNYIITMDGDLQHPPVLIPELLSGVLSGYKICQSLRQESVDERFIVRNLSKIIYFTFTKLTGIQLQRGTTDFRAISPEVSNYLHINFLDKKPFLRGYLASLNFPTKYVNFKARRRTDGKSKFTLTSLSKLSLDALLAFSTKPLVLITIVGLVVSALSFICSILILALKLFGITKITGYTTMFFAILFLSGFQILSLGTIGLYISNILSGVQNRPLYIIENSKNLTRLNSRI